MIAVPDVAERASLDAFLAGVVTYYHLYVNDLTPDAATVLGDFEEAAWPDYEAVKVTSWVPAVTVSGRAVSNGDPIIWVRGSGGAGVDVYGYYVTDTAAGPLLWCERRPAGPLPMHMPTEAVEVLPRITLREDPVGG